MFCQENALKRSTESVKYTDGGGYFLLKLTALMPTTLYTENKVFFRYFLRFFDIAVNHLFLCGIHLVLINCLSCKYDYIYNCHMHYYLTWMGGFIDKNVASYIFL